MILVFDLDDTLYEEITFVRSGFKSVANHLSEKYQISPGDSFSHMLKVLEIQGRGKVFDDVLRHYQIYTAKRVRECLAIYRQHKPEIHLAKEAEDCLNRFKDYPLYIVTDGNKLVQASKIEALGLQEKVKGVYITHRFGIRHSKPSPYCFLRICQKEKVQPQDVVYVGDNPNKDFVEIKKLGFRTIRVRTGHFKNHIKSNEYEAHISLDSLDRLTEDIFTTFKE